MLTFNLGQVLFTLFGKLIELKKLDQTPFPTGTFSYRQQANTYQKSLALTSCFSPIFIVQCNTCCYYLDPVEE